MVKMHFKNEFVAHGKIHLFDLAIVKIGCSKCRVVDFSIIKNAVIKLAIYKSNPYHIAIGKITIAKGAGFKFF